MMKMSTFNRAASRGLAVWALALVGACGGYISDTPVPFDGGTPSLATPGEAFDPAGRFATRRVVALEVKNPDTAHLFTDPSEDWFTQQTFMYLLGEWSVGAEGDVQIEEQTCYLDVSVIGGVDTVPGPDLLGALVPVRLSLTLAAPEVGAAVTSAPYADVWGARLDDSLHDPLPMSADAPTQWDQDRDGQPGVTVFLDVVEPQIRWTTYIAQRVIFSLEGAVAGPDTLSGATLVHGAQQVLFDAKPGWLATTEPEVRPSADPTLSYFKAVRVGADFTCAELMRADVRESLF